MRSLSIALLFTPGEGFRKARWLLWLEGIGHRTCLAAQQQRFLEKDSNAELKSIKTRPSGRIQTSAPRPPQWALA
jgi:hypothetical protein